MTVPGKRGFVAMNREQQRAIASKGGRAAHRKGTAHEFSSEEARKAGYLGGKVVSANREHMAAIGHKGGQHASHRLDPQRNASAPDQNRMNTDFRETPQLEKYSQHVSDHWAAEINMLSIIPIPTHLPQED